MLELEQFTAAVVEALFFTDAGAEGQPPKDAELAEETRLDLEADCRSFWRRYGCFILSEQCVVNSAHSKSVQAGHDFWLTRNGHGCGFWDGDWSDNYASMLTKGAEGYGCFDTYLGDDGLVYA